MSDGKIEYELSIEARAAVSNINAAKTSADGLADSMGKVNKASASATSALSSIPVERIKTLATLAAGAAVQLGAAALAAGGYSKQAGYLNSAAMGAMQLGAAGFMIGGAAGAAVGGAAGAASGLGKQFFANSGADVAALEAEAKLYANIAVSSEAAARAISGLKTPDQLKDAISAIDEKIQNITRSAEYGLIPGEIAARQTRELAGQRGLASSMLPGAESAEAQKRAAANAAAILSATAGFQAGREKNSFGLSLDAAKTADEKLALIDARMAKLRDTAASLADTLDPSATEESVSAILSSISSAESELNALAGARAGVKSSSSGLASADNALADRLTRIGGGFGGLSSGANDFARSTSSNTAKLVALTEKLVSKQSGGAVWAA